MEEKSIEKIVYELLQYFLRQNIVRRIESDDKKIMIYKIGESVRVDIKID